jgi:hypothetical protein
MASENATALAVRKEQAVEVVDAKPCPDMLALMADAKAAENLVPWTDEQIEKATFAELGERARLVCSHFKFALISEHDFVMRFRKEFQALREKSRDQGRRLPIPGCPTWTQVKKTYFRLSSRQIDRLLEDPDKPKAKRKRKPQPTAPGSADVTVSNEPEAAPQEPAAVESTGIVIPEERAKEASVTVGAIPVSGTDAPACPDTPVTCAGENVAATAGVTVEDVTAAEPLPAAAREPLPESSWILLVAPEGLYAMGNEKEERLFPGFGRREAQLVLDITKLCEGLLDAAIWEGTLKECRAGKEEERRKREAERKAMEEEERLAKEEKERAARHKAVLLAVHPPFLEADRKEDRAAWAVQELEERIERLEGQDEFDDAAVDRARERLEEAEKAYEEAAVACRKEKEEAECLPASMTSDESLSRLDGISSGLKERLAAAEKAKGEAVEKYDAFFRKGGKMPQGAAKRAFNAARRASEKAIDLCSELKDKLEKVWHARKLLLEEHPEFGKATEGAQAKEEAHEATQGAGEAGEAEGSQEEARDAQETGQGT